jgi:tetratricopeptide (TPR) repeat protein
MNGTGDGPGVVVRISGLGRSSDGAFSVRVSFGDASEYEVAVTDPAEPGEEDLLAWYFEEHLRYPFLDKDLEVGAVARITAYGQKLFAQVFGRDAYVDYRRLRDRGFDGCRIEVSGPAGLHRLHWEALADPDLPTPLAVRLPVTRRVTGVGSKFNPPGDRPTLNVLVVTARPDGPEDVGYRTVSRPLLDAVRVARLPVRVDLVRPGTWEALQAHLGAVKEERGSGWYQVIHFDLHGAFEDYPALEKGRKAERLLFGPGGVKPFEGRLGFLFFETAETGKAAPVPAEQVAALLAEYRVPVAVLNACQSAMQTADEAGLAQRLAEAGVPVALGMAYSVTVSAAERAMPVLYERIAAGAELTAAVRAARRELFDHPARRAYFDQQLELADWMLPVMFAQQPLQLRLRPMDDAEQAAFYGRAAATVNEPVTEYGFVGRDLDIQAIEHQLLAAPDSNVLLVRGMAGAGKSTLLTHLAWWWQRTGLVDRAFRFSYEDRAWTAAQVVREIRAQLLTPAEHARADAMPETAQAEQVAGLLRATRHVLILDNTESVIAAPAAIPHALPAGERDKLKALLGGLRGGRTLVLLGSREPETWLGPGLGTYPLPGLDPQATTALVGRILHRHGAPNYQADPAERSALAELVTLLGGYPLPLTVVLPILATAKPSEVLAELQAGGEAADPAGLIRKAVEYSHGKLDPALQASLQLLAPFTAVISAGRLLQGYQDLLLRDSRVRALSPVDLAAALDQAVTVGLATPHLQLDYLVQVQPILPWFLRSRLHAQPALQDATSQAHYQHHNDIAILLLDMLFSGDDPQRRIAGQAATEAEYANLTTAVAHGVRTGQPTARLVLVLAEYLERVQQHDTRRQLLENTIAAYPPTPSAEQQRELAILHSLAGDTALGQHRLDGAQAHHQAELQLRQALGDRHATAGAYYQLGMVAQEQRRFAEADAHYHQALDIFLEFGDRLGTARTYHRLGWSAQEQQQHADADTHYHQALDIFLELGDRHGATLAYYGLGWSAQEQRRFAHADTHYHQALDIYLEFDDQHGTALTYHQLGWVAQEQRRYDEADAYYRQSLDIKLEFGDRHTAATTYYQLGTVALAQGRFAEADAYYHQALDIYLEFGDRHRAAGAYNHLGKVAQAQQRFTDAETHYRQALDIFLEFGDRHGAARTYGQLGSLAEAQQRFTDAETHYRQALDIFLEFGDQYSAALAYHQFGGLAEAQRRFTDAEAHYRQALDIYRESDRQAACRTSLALGIMLARLGRRQDAIRALLYAAVTWHQETGRWDSQTLSWLHRERTLTDPRQFTAMIKAEIPAPLAEELTTAIDQAPVAQDEEPGEDRNFDG